MNGRRLLAAAALVLLPIAAQGAEAPRFDVPLDCEVGTDCFVQNYVDEDPGPGARDFTCGGLTYDGHKGTDIRLPNLVAMARGVAVLAAAPGTVLRTRDGMPDISIRDPNAPSVANREAGNAVIIDHGGGWVTQYAHMRQGSVRVEPGDKVVAGQPLGLVGLSGDTEFPHVHFEVRHGDRIVDPYLGPLAAPACGEAGQPMWSKAALAAIAYRPSGLLGAGFAPQAPSPEAARHGNYGDGALPADSAALVFWIDLFGVQTGDRETMRLIAPDGAVVAENSATAPKPLAQAFRFVGRKRRGPAWPAGIYHGEYKLVRQVDGQTKTVVSATKQIELR